MLEPFRTRDFALLWTGCDDVARRRLHLPRRLSVADVPGDERPGRPRLISAASFAPAVIFLTAGGVLSVVDDVRAGWGYVRDAARGRGRGGPRGGDRRARDACRVGAPLGGVTVLFLLASPALRRTELEPAGEPAEP